MKLTKKKRKKEDDKTETDQIMVSALISFSSLMETSQEIIRNLW